jgi:DNA-binding transcriptional ArsR family regulator
MAPMELDLNSGRYKVDIIPSKTVEMIAAVQILANRNQYEFANDFTASLYNRLTPESRDFIDLLSGLRFPGAEFFGFFQYEGIYNDFDRFIEKISSHSGMDFIYLAFDRDIPRDRIERVKNGEEGLSEFISELCCHLWKGNKEIVKALIFDTENYKVKLLNLAKEIYYDKEFGRITDGLSNAYRQSAEDINQRLMKISPLELAREIKGKKVSAEQSFNRYIFFPSYFMNEFNITAWDCEKGVFMLFYNIKTSDKVDVEEIDRLLSILKSLSDRTRLQILQSLKNTPSYGKKLAEELKLSTASISRQLEQLRSMNLITEERSDGFKYFKLNSKEIDKLIKLVQEFFSTK